MGMMDRATDLLAHFKFQLGFAAVVGVAAIALVRAGPSFASVVTFFWPLFVSTVFLLAAVAVLLRISPPSGDSLEETAGQEIMHYVAGAHVESSSSHSHSDSQEQQQAPERCEVEEEEERGAEEEEHRKLELDYRGSGNGNDSAGAKEKEKEGGF